jgi:hypothetical protein
MAEPQPLNVYTSVTPYALIRKNIQRLLPALTDLLQRQAQQHSIPVDRVEVSEFMDPEGGPIQTIVRQWVQTTSREALDYWANLDQPLQKWIDSLPRDMQDIAIDHITVSVRWLKNE